MADLYTQTHRTQRLALAYVEVGTSRRPEVGEEVLSCYTERKRPAVGSEYL